MTDRMLRVNELLKRELGELFTRLIGGLTDALVTVTQVQTSPDLKHSKVFVSVYGTPEQRDEVMRLLARRRREMQEEINRAVKLKYTPRLRFITDETPASADHITQLLNTLVADDDETESDA